MSQFFASGGQSIEASTSASVLKVNIQDWFPLEWTGLISSQSKGFSKVFSNTTVQKHQFFSAQLSLYSKLSHPYMTARKPIALTIQTFDYMIPTDIIALNGTASTYDFWSDINIQSIASTYREEQTLPPAKNSKVWIPHRDIRFRFWAPLIPLREDKCTESFKPSYILEFWNGF